MTAALENYANNSSPALTSNDAPQNLRARRYARRSVLHSLSSLHRLHKCGRVRRDMFVGVVVGPEGSGLSGLCTCGSVWACPVCSAKIMARRRIELGAAIAQWQSEGGQVLFATHTIRHHRGQGLDQLWGAVTKAWSVLTSGKSWQLRKSAMGLLGYVRAVEVTYGKNGWHVHIHALLFVEAGLSDDALADYSAWSSARWVRAVVRQGLAAPLHSLQDVRRITGPADADLSEYLSKSTDLGWELTGSQSKRARSAHGTNPAWFLLSELMEGDADALTMWHEMEQGSHGKRQMTWSKGLRERLVGGREATDEQIAADSLAGDEVAFITKEGWDLLVATPALIPELLTVAETGTKSLMTWLDGHEIEYLDHRAALRFRVARHQRKLDRR